MQKNKSKQAKGPLGGFIGYLLSIVLSAILVVYLGYHFVKSFGTELSTEYAVLITENDTMEYDAYILRNETVIHSENAGSVGYSVSDGTKVKNGAEIAFIYGSGSSYNSAIQSEIMQIDRKIELLNESNNTVSFAVSDTSTIDSRIDGYYRIVRENAEQGEYENLPKRRDELLTLLNKRQIITGRIKNFDDIIASMNYERELLTEGLDSVSETVYSPASGFFYSSIDGFEKIFTADAAEDMTVELFDSMLSAEPASHDSTAIGKLATDFTWFIAIETTRDELRYYNDGYSYVVIFPYNNDTKLRMKLESIISPDTSNRVILLFSSHEVPEDFTFRRLQQVEVVKSSYTGYKVPTRAVRLVDGKMGVYILVGSTVEYRYIDVLLECDGYYIVAVRDPANDPEYYLKLDIFDIIITGGKDLYAGKLIS